MKNGLNVLLLILLAGCPPLLGQDETNSTSVETNVSPYGNGAPYGSAGAYGNAGVYSNAGPYGYGNPMPMPAQPPPPGARPRLRPTMRARPLMLDSNQEQPRVSSRARAIPGTEFAAPPPVRLSNGPIPQLHAIGRFGAFGWTVEVCTNAEDLTNGCLEIGLRQAGVKLWNLFDQEYHQGRHVGELKVILPASLSPEQQTNFLYQVESSAIQITQHRVAMANGRFALRAGDSPQVRQDKQTAQTALNNAVQAWAEKAQTEAGAGSNWVHDWPANAHTFVFRGAAFEQFKAISQAIREEPALSGAGGN